jgi:hypothetical protein
MSEYRAVVDSLVRALRRTRIVDFAMAKYERVLSKNTAAADPVLSKYSAAADSRIFACR